MTTLKFSVNINAPKEKVWETLWNDATYRQWTAAFCEGSYAKGDWEEGSKILFLIPNGDGMFSTVEKKIPNEQMVFRHLGVVKNGIEEPKDWENATESYYLAENNGFTKLDVALGAALGFEEYLNDTFPKALEILKQVAEQ